MPAPDPITIALCYLFIGTVIWAFAFGTESWSWQFDQHAYGAVIVASIFLIMCWLPLVLLFAWAAFVGGRMVERAKRRAF
jgi:hypothetical protein